MRFEQSVDRGAIRVAEDCTVVADRFEAGDPQQDHVGERAIALGLAGGIEDREERHGAPSRGAAGF